MMHRNLPVPFVAAVVCLCRVICGRMAGKPSRYLAQRLKE